MVKLIILCVTLLAAQAYSANTTSRVYATQSYGPSPVSSYNSPPYGSSYPPRDPRQPIYIQAAQVSHPSLVDWQVHEYANAIVADIQFGSYGEILFVGLEEHEECDCGLGCKHHSPIDVYLKHVSSIVNTKSPKYNSQLVQLYTVPHGLDDASAPVLAAAGRNLFKAINGWLFENGNPSVYINVVHGIGELSYEPYVRGYEQAESENSQLDAFYGTRQGWDFYDTDAVDLCEVQRMFERVDSTPGSKNIWQSNGRSICWTQNTCKCEPPLNLLDIERTLEAKNQLENVKKASVWTVTQKRDMILALNHGFDNIGTGEPRLLWELINSPPYNQCYRLATWADSPWVKVEPAPLCLVSSAKSSSSYGSTSYGSPSYDSICGLPPQSLKSDSCCSAAYPPSKSYSSAYKPMSSSYSPVSSYTPPVASYAPPMPSYSPPTSYDKPSYGSYNPYV